MGSFKTTGNELESVAFQHSFIDKIHDMIAEGTTPSIAFINLNFGFDVELPKGETAEEMARLFKAQSKKPDSDFKTVFVPAFKPIFDLLDSIPAVNVLKSLGIIDPTSALLPISNLITELLANVGIPNPNQILLERLNQILAKQVNILDKIKIIATETESKITSAVAELSSILNEIIPEISIEKLKTNISDSVNKIRSLYNLEIEFAPIQLPNISDFIEFLKLKVPKLPDMPDLPDISVYISKFFDFGLEIPPIGVMFVEILKVKLKILAELILAATPAGILNPPDFLKAAIDEAKKMLTLDFSIQSFLREVARSFFAKFFIELEANEKIKNLIKNAPTLVSVLHSTILVLVGSLVTLVVGILFGEGFIMKTSAIGLGLID